jgi:small subunit ribosomal protein S9
MSDETKFQAVGRRKTSSARVTIRPGSGQWSINGRTLEDYFPRQTLRTRVTEALDATENEGTYDVMVRVQGGGLTGQADAVRLGLARCIVKLDEDHRPALRSRGLLTRDSRKVERKKPGRPKARKRFQFSKR